MNKTELSKKIQRQMRVRDCKAGGPYPQCYVWVIASHDSAGNIVMVRKIRGPHGNAYDPVAHKEVWVRFSLDCDDHVRYREGPWAGAEAKGREAVALRADDCAQAILEALRPRIQLASEECLAHTEEQRRNQMIEYQTLLDCGYKYAVVVTYDGPYGEKGRLLSKYRTYPAAEKAARKFGDWCEIRAISDYATGEPT